MASGALAPQRLRCESDWRAGASDSFHHVKCAQDGAEPAVGVTNGISFCSTENKQKETKLTKTFSFLSGGEFGRPSFPLLSYVRDFFRIR